MKITLELMDYKDEEYDPPSTDHYYVVLDEITKFIRENHELHLAGVTEAHIKFEIDKKKYYIFATDLENAESAKEEE